MNFQLIASESVSATTSHFWCGMRIWFMNPHLVNKRISSSKTVFIAELNSNDIESVIAQISNINVVSMLIENDINENIHTLNIDKLTPLLLDTDVFTDTHETGIFLMINVLFPRDNSRYSRTVEFSIIDKDNSIIISLHKCTDEKKSLAIAWPYRISFKNSQLFNMYLDTTDCGLHHPNVEWCKHKLIPRLIKWITNAFDTPKTNSMVKESVSLVSINEYTQLYDHLKKKYGVGLIEKWTECTDPKKFVYEDIAIASYLILLWEKERREKKLDSKQTFVDLGCGNGLLVYILTNEGHPGLGIDLRKRKIWDLFAETTRLEERTVVPSSCSLFPDTDWLIGNHSDELTPWIPVIAARSSYKCRFFLLPCCAHEFDGRKFQRDSASTSQYSQYLSYIKNVCETCGFETQVDRLRIPSTKRICLIGWSRIYSEDKTKWQDECIEKIINARSSKRINIEEDSNISSEKWSLQFKPRDPIEKVRNCTQIDRSIIDEIVETVAKHLLQKVRIINSADDGNKKWNAGGSMEMSEVAKIIPAISLKQLKKECGGLQTLLRNNSHIFQIIDGLVQLRVPGTVMNVNKRNRHRKSNLQIKVKPCWFFNNHPDGCLLTDEKCNFKH